MRLNYECVRDVLLKLEELLLIEYDDKSDCFEFNKVSIQQIYEAFPREKYSIEDILYTVMNLAEADFIKVKYLYGCGAITSAIITAITYDGNEFINKIRPDTIWGKIKKAFVKIGSVSLPIISEVASSLAVTGISSVIGSL